MPTILQDGTMRAKRAALSSSYQEICREAQHNSNSSNAHGKGYCEAARASATAPSEMQMQEVRCWFMLIYSMTATHSTVTFFIGVLKQDPEQQHVKHRCSCVDDCRTS